MLQAALVDLWFPLLVVLKKRKKSPSCTISEIVRYSFTTLLGARIFLRASGSHFPSPHASGIQDRGLLLKMLVFHRVMFLGVLLEF